MQPLYLMTNNNTLAFEDGGGGGSAIGAGALRYRDGKFAGSQAALIEEGTLNLVHDPTVMSGAFSAGWSEGAKDDSFGHSFGRSYTRTGSGRLRPHNNRENAPLSGAPSLTSSAWMYCEAAPVGTSRAIRYMPDGTFISPADTGQVISVENTWQRIVDTFPEMADQTSLRDYWWEFSGIATGEQIWITEAQIEEKDHVTSFCPELDAEGNLLPGYAWTGTAHNSPSTRDAASITIPVDYDDVGSWACWYSEDMGQTWQFHYAELFGPIGDYGAILPVPDTTTSVVDSARALLLGPLAIWADTLTEDEQAALENHGAMWTWDIASGNFPSGSRGPIHVIPAIPVIPATDVLPSIEVVAVAT